MPPALKREVVRIVASRQASMNDVVVEILARRFDVPFAPSGRKGGSAGESGVVILRMPPELKREIQASAFAQGSNTNNVIVNTLAEELGLELPPPRHTRVVPFGGGRRKESMASSNG